MGGIYKILRMLNDVTIEFKGASHGKDDRQRSGCLG
jgi:hypothetical protein